MVALINSVKVENDMHTTLHWGMNPGRLDLNPVRRLSSSKMFWVDEILHPYKETH